MTHPHRILRLQMIFCSWPKKTKYHPYLLELSQYMKSHRVNVTLTQKDMELMSNEFRRILRVLGFKRYVSSNDNGDAIKEYIENNSSYIYATTGEDVRKLLNGLPDKAVLNEKARMNYNEFLLESIRKNAMLRQFFAVKKELATQLPSNA